MVSLRKKNNQTNHGQERLYGRRRIYALTPTSRISLRFTGFLTLPITRYEMSGAWSSPWRLGIGLQVSSSRAAGFFKFQEPPWETPRLKIQCLQQNRSFSVWLDLFTLSTKPCSRLSKTKSVSPHQHIRRYLPRYAHSLSGIHSSRSPKSGISAKANKRTLRPKQFNFSAKEIRLIFQGSLSTEEGNQLLQILQKQRVAGTLDEKVEASPNDVLAALEWLRIKIPVDEDQAIIARLEREEQEDDAKAAKITSYVPQRDAHLTGLYGPSRFEEIRRINRQKAADRAAQLENELMKDPGTKEIQTQNTSGTALTIRKRPDWVVRYREAATMQGKMPPSMSKFERLWPSALVAFVTVGLSIFLAQNYIPPSRRARLWPDFPPAAATIFALVGINAAIFLAWRVPPLWKFLNRTFIVTAAYPYAKGIIGGVFSHQGLKHLALNMIFLWIVGTRCSYTQYALHFLLLTCLVHDDVGRGVFLSLYFSCGAIGMLTSLSTSVLRNSLATSTLGASGSICGIAACWCMLHAQLVPRALIGTYADCI